MADHFYSKDFDFDPWHGSRHTYLLATLPRAGSTYCAVQFWRTGLMGAPLEYLNLQDMKRVLVPRLVRARQLEDADDTLCAYWQDVKRIRTSQNGVFGCKIFMQSLYVLMRNHFSIFQDLKPEYVIYLTRKDVVAQAVSLSRAMRSSEWFASGSDSSVALDFDFDHIDKCLGLIFRQLSFWEDVFARSETRPVRIFYEDLNSNPELVVASIMKKMGISGDPSRAINIPGLQRQSDQTSQIWRKLYLEALRIRAAESDESAHSKLSRIEAVALLGNSSEVAGEREDETLEFRLDGDAPSNLRTAMCASMISSLILEGA